MDKAIANCPHFYLFYMIELTSNFLFLKHLGNIREKHVLSGEKTKHEVRKEKRETSKRFTGSATTLFQMAGLCQEERTGKKHKKISGIYQKRNKTCTQ